MVEADSIEEGNKEHLKIVNLMNIFFEMVSSFTTYPNPDPEYHASGLVELRKIVEIDTLQQLCETASNYLFKSNNYHTGCYGGNT